MIKKLDSLHLYGQACEMNEIISLAKKHNLKIICDSAQSPGALYYGVHSDTIGDIGGYSLNYHKKLVHHLEFQFYQELIFLFHHYS